MYTKVYDNPAIYKIDVPLPNNPLRNLNSYVIKTPTRDLVIDTGFNQPECYAALTEGLKELQVDMHKADLYLTHLHSDHTGLAEAIITDDTTVYMSDADYEYLKKNILSNQWELAEMKFHKEGFPLSEIEAIRNSNPARAFAPKQVFTAKTVNDGDKIKVGDLEFTVILTPGHTPGNTCLYLEREKIMFTGDHILFDITPNITSWFGVADSLGNYLESLKKIRTYDIKLALPAHRKNDMDVYERIDAILEHHKQRLANTLEVISANEGLNAYQIAGLMRWSIRAKNWEEFPLNQKWFAVGETMSHLDYLLLRDKLVQKTEGEYHTYYIKK